MDGSKIYGRANNNKETRVGDCLNLNFSISWSVISRCSPFEKLERFSEFGLIVSEAATNGRRGLTRRLRDEKN